MKTKKILIFIILSIAALFPAGCSRVEEQISQIMWERSGVSQDASYLQYLQMQEAQALDEEGRYRSKEVAAYQQHEQEKSEGQVHVTFARNDFLSLSFFRDSAMTESINTEDCRLDPGDGIYAGEPVVLNPNSSLYHFSELRVIELDDNGNYKQLLSSTGEIPGEVFRIPEDFTGTDITIIPLGEYENRTISLSVVSINPDGTKTSMGKGSWEIDGRQFGNVQVKLNPLSSYRLEYDYSPYKNDWYFASSVPESYWDNTKEGKITFQIEPSDEAYTEYEIRLHPYSTMTIRNGVNYQNVIDSLLDGATAIFENRNIIETQNIISLLQINGETVINNFSDTEVTASSLKAGDEIMIRVPSNLKVISDQLKLPAPTISDAGREYRFVLPESIKTDYHLTVNFRNSDQEAVFHETSLEHGSFEVYDASGIRYTEGSELPANDEKVTVVITPDADYCIYGKKVKENIYRAEMKYEDLTADYEKILTDHPIKPGIFVELDTEDEMGTCVFWTGNQMLSGRVMLREGQDLQLDYLLDPDSGYHIILTPEEQKQFVNVWSPYAAARELDVDESMQGQILRCRDFITLEEGSVTDDIAVNY